MSAEGTERRLAAILHADVVGFSRLMAEDEDTTVRLVTTYREEVELLVHQHRGVLADFTGDNFLAEFGSAVAAVQCAIETQKVRHARNELQPPERRMEFRMGVHLGEVRVEGERLCGTGVNVAARLQALAEPGGLCISGEVQGQVEGKLVFEFEDLGEQEVKNIPEPVHVYRVKVEAQVAPETSQSPTRRTVLAAGLVVLLAALAVLAWRTFTVLPEEPVAAAISTPIRSIAVLPLENLSGDPEQEYFADGMTDAMILDLTRIRALRVTSFTSAKRYRKSDKSLPEIAQELNVDGIIEGTVMRAGGRVRITVQLIDARDDRNIWADRYDRDLSDVLGLQSDVALQVADQIRLELTPQEVAGFEDRPVVNPEAHDAYLRGMLHLAEAEPGALQAIDYFEQAIERDPEHALAYAGIARAYLVLSWGYGSFPSKEAMPKMRAAAEKALALDESLGSAHSALGLVRWAYDWEWEQGEAKLRQGLELSPNDPWALQVYGYYLVAVGRYDAAVRLSARSIEVEPLNLFWRAMHPGLLILARDYERAVEGCLQVLEIEPDYLFAHVCLRVGYELLGREEEAHREFVRVFRLAGQDEEWLREFERAYQEAGSEGASRYILASQTERAKTQYADAFTIALRYATLGEADSAFEWLERAYQERHSQLVYLAVTPEADHLRSDPRFDDVLRRINYPGAS
jgi:TolB-like protein/class 3 adenylate cyclase/Tfp pilus assembly protein PilF